MFLKLPLELHKSISNWFLILLLSFPLISALSLNVVKKKKDLDHDHNHNEGHHIHNHTGICYTPLYGENPYFTRRLFNLEEQLAQELTEILDDLKYDTSPVGVSCSQSLARYLREQKRDAEAIEADRHRCSYGMQTRADIVAENPLFTLKMLRRLIISLQSQTLSDCVRTEDNEEDDAVSQAFYKVFKMHNLVVPEPEQLEVAVDAVLTLLFVYGFNVSSDLRNGKFYDYQTKARLDFADIIQILNRVLDQDEHGFMTYEWLTAAEEAIELEEENESSRKLLQAYWEKALGNLGKKSVNQFKREFAQIESSDDDWGGYQIRGEKLCRGKYLSDKSHTHTPFLTCAYRMHYITPIKVEVLARAPLIFQFHDFLTTKEILFIKYQSPSFAIKPWEIDEEWDSSSRESYHFEHFTKLAEEAMVKNGDPILVNLIDKVETAVNRYSYVPKENASIFEKGLHTPISGYWNVELTHDYITGYSTNETTLPWSSFLMFLTDVHMGGYTTFPKLNVYSKPYKGSALYFVNFDYNEIPKPDERILHESCPVILGVKEVAHIRMKRNLSRARITVQPSTSKADPDKQTSSA